MGGVLGCLFEIRRVGVDSLALFGFVVTASVSCTVSLFLALDLDFCLFVCLVFACFLVLFCFGFRNARLSCHGGRVCVDAGS